MRFFMAKRWVVTVAVCLLLFSVLAGYKFFEIFSSIQAAAAQPEFFETVETFTTKRVDYTPMVKALGTALAPRKVTLRNELPGYITSVNFEAGAQVNKDDVIIQLDISEQLANLESAKARAKLAQTIYDRDLSLRKSQTVSEERLERSRAELTVVNAEITAITSVIDRKTIRAPFDGVIGIFQFEPGQYLQSNTEITTLVGQSGQMWINFSLPQFYGDLEIGVTAHVHVVRTPSVIPKQSFEAKIIAGDSAISAGGRSRLYRALVENKDAGLLHNAAVEVNVPVGASRSLISVPSQAVQSSVNGQYVFALVPDDEEGAYRARSIPVTVEGEQGDIVYVAGDLQENLLIAANGAFKLREGLLVRTNTRPDLTNVNRGQ